jgi:hypothetical protein
MDSLSASGGMAFFLIDYAAKKKEEAIPGR